jgi:hypothetical protein
MLRVSGAIVFLVLAHTVLMLAAGLPANYAAGATILVPVIGFAAVAWAFVPERNRR